uniref:VP2 n=1 Tax=Tarsiger cyanurus ambidensovirus TaxID=2794449 RepID=A0A8A4XE69_9VIRU|nr:MAG: VP2 [Tarsiger cyanurus ambidensovirus]
MVWKNIHPSEKPNWDSLHEGQRRYAVEQYNLALVRRGLPVDHPVPEKEEAPREDSGAAPELSAEEQQVIDDFDTDLLDDDHHSMAPPIGGTRSAEADSPSAPVAKKAKGPKADKRKADSMGSTSLPGTAMDQGGGGGGGDDGRSTVRQVALPNPTLSIHPHVRHYRKVHRFLTYGLSYRVMMSNYAGDPATQVAGADLIILTTPLAMVPWDKPYLYLNPSEFNALPTGSHIGACRVTVIARNVRIAFPTNETASKLATLNQNKDVMYAIGLNKNVHAVDLQYTVKEMKPQTSKEYTANDEQLLANRFYGDKITKDSTNVPHHQVGLPIPLPWYATIPHMLRTGVDEGWPCLQAYYRDMDADTVVGKELCSVEYHPKMGHIKAPQAAIYQTNKYKGSTVGFAQEYTIPRNGMKFIPQQTTVTVDAEGQVASYTETNRTVKEEVPTAFDWYLEPIEKSQFMSQGIFGAGDTQAQDSLHIGIQPVQAITPGTGGTDQTIAQYTDCQAYFEVICEAEVNTSYPTPYPLFPVTHVTEHGVTFFANNPPDHRSKAMINGLYQVNVD